MSKGNSKKIEDVSDPKGECEVKLDSNIRKLGRCVSSLAVEVFYNLSNCEGLCKDIEFHLTKASEYYSELAAQTQTLSDKYNDVVTSCNYEPLKPVSELYKAMTEGFREQSKIMAEEVKSFSRNIKMMFDFSIKEVEGLGEVILCMKVACDQEKPLLDCL